MKLMCIFLVLVVAFITGCAAPPVSFTTSEGKIVWHKGTLRDIQYHCTGGNIKDPSFQWTLGCYIMIDNVCHVYSQDTEKGMYTLGHEVKHCFDGHYHDKEGKWK